MHADYPLVRAPRGLMVNYSLPPVAIALGNRALTVALASLRERVSRGVTRMAASEFVQMTVAEAAAAIDAATLTMHSGRAAAEALVASGEPIPQDIVLRTRRDMTYAQHRVQRAVEKLVEVCGARSVYDADAARLDPTRRADGADAQHRQPPGGDGSLGEVGAGCGVGSRSNRVNDMTDSCRWEFHTGRQWPPVLDETEVVSPCVGVTIVIYAQAGTALASRG